MGQKDALVKRFLTMPKDFEQRELDALMKQCGCTKSNRGRTSGSAIQYVHDRTKRIFQYHQPHPGNIIKPYIMKAAKQFLQDVGEIPTGEKKE